MHFYHLFSLLYVFVPFPEVPPTDLRKLRLEEVNLVLSHICQCKVYVIGSLLLSFHCPLWFSSLSMDPPYPTLDPH